MKTARIAITLSVVCLLSNVDPAVSGVNNCPIATPSSVDVNQDSSVNFQLQASDPDFDPLQFQIVVPPAHGTVVVTVMTGASTYTPSPGYCGPDSFTFTVGDFQCTSAPAQVRINVICANRCPTASPLSVQVNAGSSVSFQLVGNDPDGDPIQYAITQAPAHGVVVVNVNTGANTYTPNAGYCGPDSFAYGVTDGQCQSDPATVTIDVVCLVTEVDIDIKPGSDPNSFKCGSKGVLPVAILSSATFDATEIDVSTVELGTTGGDIGVSSRGAPREIDVNGDGLTDLIVYFNSRDVASGIGCPLSPNTEVTVTIEGSTLGGEAFEGSDVLRIAK